MNSREYIDIIIKGLHSDYPSFTFRYQFDGLDNSHVIEYSPFDLTEGNIDFENRKYSLLDNYYDNSFAEGLVFINEHDPVGLSSPEMVFEGYFNFVPTNLNPQIVQPKGVSCPEGVVFAEENNFALAA